MTGRRLWGASAVLVVVGLAAESAALQRVPLQQAVQGAEVRRAVADLLVGWIVGGCGVAAWTLRPGRRLGPLLMVAAVAWFLGTLADSGVGWVASVGAALVLLHRAPLVHALISYPEGGGAGRLGRVAIGAAYVLAIPALGGNTVRVIVLGALTVAAITQRLLRSGPSERLALYPPLVTAVALDATMLTGSLPAYEIVVAGGATWLLTDLLRARWTESAVAGLVLALGRGTAGPPLERRLADVLGDPSVRLAYRLEGHEGFIDGSGRSLGVLDGGRDRRVTYLGGHEPMAALVHDPGAVADPGLLRSVAAVARIAVSNARLQSAVRERLDELVDSRRRVVEAADAQRERLERRLRLGPQETLAEVRRTLAACRCGDDGPEFVTLLEETMGEVDRALDELSEFARGVRPRVLSEGGIGPGVAELARRSTMPVRVSVPSARFSPALEAVVYFVCAEALANAGKHAAASRASIEIVHQASQLEVTVTDDGCGGADVAAGSGLRGLRDRVEALSGVLTVESPRGGGTRLHALLPVESA